MRILQKSAIVLIIMVWLLLLLWLLWLLLLLLLLLRILERLRLPLLCLSPLWLAEHGRRGWLVGTKPSKRTPPAEQSARCQPVLLLLLLLVVVRCALSQPEKTC